MNRLDTTARVGVVRQSLGDWWDGWINQTATEFVGTNAAPVVEQTREYVAMIQDSELSDLLYGEPQGLRRGEEVPAATTLADVRADLADVLADAADALLADRAEVR